MMCRRLRLTSAKLSACVLALLLVYAVLPCSANGAQNGVGASSGYRVPLAPGPVSLSLSGWGWHVGREEVGNVTLSLDGSMIARDNVTNLNDLYLEGTLLFNLPDRTDSFSLQLRGTKLNSIFFLKQVTGEDNPLIAEFEGVWFDAGEPAYVACEGRLAVPESGSVASGYVVILRNRDLGTMVIPGGSVLGRLTALADGVADRIVSLGTGFQKDVGDILGNMAELVLQLVWQI